VGRDTATHRPRADNGDTFNNSGHKPSPVMIDD
jgi:hypothetical protein